MKHRIIATFILILATGLPGWASTLNELSLERWAKLREVERYQLQIAEEYYRKGDWKVAAAEYEKYLTLYELSEAGAYAQLKWSLAMLQLRQANTAISDGFQSVIDYWPDAPEALAAAYYIGRAYKDIGQIANAKKAYGRVLENDANHPAVVRAMVDLVDIAEVENDQPTRAELWRKLVFDVERTKETTELCGRASRRLAAYYFSLAAFDEGRKALATTCSDDTLPTELTASVRDSLRQLVSDEGTRARADKLASAAVEYLRDRATSDLSDPDRKELARRRWYDVAQVQAAAGMDAEVVETYSTIMKTFGADDDTLGRLAAWQSSVGRYEDARRTCRQFVDQIEGIGRIAAGYREEHNWDLAVATYRELAERDSNEGVRWNVEIASTYYQALKYDEAIAAYTDLLALDPVNAEKWRWQVACAYRDSGQHQEAIGWYRQCTNFPYNYREMAGCQRVLGQFQEAIALYAQIAGGHPASAPWAMLQIGYTLEQAGDREKAIKAFQQVCRQFPTNSYASRAHVHLQNKYNISITLGGAKDE